MGVFAGVFTGGISEEFPEEKVVKQEEDEPSSESDEECGGEGDGRSFPAVDELRDCCEEEGSEAEDEVSEVRGPVGAEEIIDEDKNDSEEEKDLGDVEFT